MGMLQMNRKVIKKDDIKDKKPKHITTTHFTDCLMAVNI